MLPLILFVCVLQLSAGSPLPNDKMTLDQFRSGARALDFGKDSRNYVISGYSQVRMQGGGRALENNYKFPTQTVNNPNQLNIEGVSKVKVNLANPVYNKEDEKNLQFIADKIQAINENEGERLRQLEKEEQVKQALQEAKEKVEAVMKEVEEIKEEFEDEEEEEEVETTTLQDAEILEVSESLEMNVVEVETADPSLNLVVDNALDIAEEFVEDVEDVEDVGEEEAKEADEEKENVEEEEGSGEEPVAEPEAEPEAESDSTKEPAELSIEEVTSTSSSPIDFGDIQEI